MLLEMAITGDFRAHHRGPQLAIPGEFAMATDMSDAATAECVVSGLRLSLFLPKMNPWQSEMSCCVSVKA